MWLLGVCWRNRSSLSHGGFTWSSPGRSGPVPELPGAKELRDTPWIKHGELANTGLWWDSGVAAKRGGKREVGV